VPIRELAEIIVSVVGYNEPDIRYDQSRYARKLLDVSRSTGGMERTYEWFKEHSNDARL
jgi:hypothetical protein